MSSQAEHYRKAEKYAGAARLELQGLGRNPPTPSERERAVAYAAIAQVHATLATVDDHVVRTARGIEGRAVE